MTLADPEPRRRSLRIEYAFAALIAAGLIWTAIYFYRFGYLPQPWFYEPSGTFMDWYSLAHWGHLPGAYDIERTIYPPLSFVVMKVFGQAECYRNAIGEPSRDCDHWGIYALSAMVVINLVLTTLAYRKLDRASYLPRAFAMSLGLPMLYAYERGNLILFCYGALLLAYGPLLKSARLRWFFGGMTVNFKVYMIAAIVAPLLRRRWLQVEGMLIAAAAIYLVTWQILGEGSPQEILRNVTSYASSFGAGGVLDIWYAGSFVPVISLLKGETFPVLTILDSRSVDILLPTVVTYVRITQVMILLAAAASWLRPEVVPTTRMVFLAIAFALTTSEAGGYTQILLLMFVFMEPWRGRARPIAIVAAYFLCIPADIVIMGMPPLVRWSWLAGTEIIAQYGVGLLALLRPFFAYLIVHSLCAATLRDVWTDIRHQGWSHRWRYRHDTPMLPGIEPPRPAA